jgi:hypothetical protein
MNEIRVRALVESDRLWLVAVHRNAVEQARRIKPQIPAVGSDGIPLRDEIELEKRLSP